MQSGGGKEWDVFQDSEGDDQHSESGDSQESDREEEEDSDSSDENDSDVDYNYDNFFSGFTAVFAELHEDSVEF